MSYLRFWRSGRSSWRMKRKKVSAFLFRFCLSSISGTLSRSWTQGKDCFREGKGQIGRMYGLSTPPYEPKWLQTLPLSTFPVYIFIHCSLWFSTCAWISVVLMVISSLNLSKTFLTSLFYRHSVLNLTAAIPSVAYPATVNPVARFQSGDSLLETLKLLRYSSWWPQIPWRSCSWSKYYIKVYPSCKRLIVHPQPAVVSSHEQFGCRWCRSNSMTKLEYSTSLQSTLTTPRSNQYMYCRMRRLTTLLGEVWLGGSLRWDHSDSSSCPYCPS